MASAAQEDEANEGGEMIFNAAEMPRRETFGGVASINGGLMDHHRGDSSIYGSLYGSKCNVVVDEDGSDNGCEDDIMSVHSSAGLLPGFTQSNYNSFKQLISNETRAS